MLSKFISNRSLVSGAALLASVLLSVPAWAEGFYADVHGGAAFFEEDSARVTAQDSGGSINAHTNFDPGWLAGASAGYEWPLGLVSEFEFTFRQNHVDRIAGSTPLFLGGDMHSYAMMLNGYYRFHNSTPFTPYVGAGLGEAVVALNNARPVTFDSSPFGGTDAVFAYQGIAGVSYPICPHLDIAAEYRYFGTLRPGFQQTINGEEVKVSPTYRSNNALLRLVYTFN